ncbi:MAG: beta-ketoacyl-ACP synthase II [bacterium]
MSLRKVVVTGTGMVTALGPDRGTTWDGLINGRNGVSRIEGVDLTDMKVLIAAQAKSFDPSVAMEDKEIRKADRYCQFAMAASVEAMAEAGITGMPDPLRAGVIIGSGMGGMITFQEQTLRYAARGSRAVSPMFIPMTIADMASGLVSIRFGFRGANYCTVSACASGGHAIGAAADQIRLGYADLMICGGAEAGICEMGVSGFANMKALSTRNDEPEKASRPFDLDRDGFIIGEGAGILVLESEEHALARGADILAEFRGYGFTADAYHITQPDNEGRGAIGSMKMALDVAGLEPTQVGYINAHGTSTYFNDKGETAAIKAVFGDHARKVKISSTKSMIGHLLGAAGGVEAVITCLALREGILPPTINQEKPDPECDLDYCPNEAVRATVDHAISNSFGFGGHNVSLCFGARR